MTTVGEVGYCEWVGGELGYGGGELGYVGGEPGLIIVIVDA